LAKIKENKRKINSLTYPQIRIHGGWFETELIRAQKDSSSIAPVSLLEKWKMELRKFFLPSALKVESE